MYDSDEFDDYLFDSIGRYHILQMYDLDNNPHHLLQIDDSSVCIASQRSRGTNSELLRLKLPGKLVLPPEEEGRCKENDLKYLSGAYTENLVYSIDQLRNEEKVITSEHNVAGLQMYSLEKSSLDLKSRSTKLNVVEWESAEFVVIRERNHLVCCKNIWEPILQVDLEALKKVKSFSNPFYKSDISFNICTEQNNENLNNINCQTLGNNMVAILKIDSGDVALKDLRVDDWIHLTNGENRRDGEIWSISKHDSRFSEADYFGIMSNKQSFCIYDKKKCTKLCESTGNNLPKENCMSNLRMKFNEKGDKFSTSGTDSLVNVFSLNDNTYTHVFTHNGHNSSKSSNIVTDHIWLTLGNKELIISICNNKTMNCWEYKT